MKLLSAVLIGIFFTNVYAQDLMYPELQVTPRASDRIGLERKYEADNAWTAHLPVQVSALSTLVAGVMIQGADLDPDLTGDDKTDAEDAQKYAGLLGIGVGAAWLGITYWASSQYRPYAKAYKEVKRIKGKSKRAQLTRERLAEEELNRLRTLGKRIRWISAISNFAASSYMGSVDVDPEARMPQLVANLSAAVSLLPLFLPYRWEHVADEQESYKKKIYGPVSYAPIMMDPFVGTRASGMSLQFTF
jgi:hypothetical protein